MRSPVLRPSLASAFVLGAMQILAWGGSFFLMAVIGGPVVADTGWSAKWVYGALSIGILVSGLLAPLCGRLIDRFGGRLLLSWSGVVIAAGLVLVAGATHLAVFMVAWVIIGAGMALGLYDTLFSTLGHLYGHEARRTISEITLISGFCPTVVWPAVTLLVSHLGWRSACQVYALTLAISVFPAYRAALPGSGVMAAVVHRTASEGPGIDDRTYVLMTMVFTIAAVLMTAISAHLIQLLQGQGYSVAAAVGIGALIGPCAVGSRIVEILGKKRHPIATTLTSTTLVAGGLALLALWPLAAAVGVAMYSAGNGLRAIVRGTLPLVLVSARQYAAVMGRMARPVLIGQALTPLLGGSLIESFGAKAAAFSLAALAIVNLVLAIFLKRHLAASTAGDSAACR